jgi:hypothetical protein
MLNLLLTEYLDMMNYLQISVRILVKIYLTKTELI